MDGLRIESTLPKSKVEQDSNVWKRVVVMGFVMRIRVCLNNEMKLSTIGKMRLSGKKSRLTLPSRRDYRTM